MKEFNMRGKLTGFAISAVVTGALCGCPLTTKADSKVTTIIDGREDARMLSKITFDGDNITLTFDDSTTLTSDMNLVSVTLDHTDANAVNEIINDTSKPTGVYNLKGQRIADTPEGLKPGLYIANGQKILVK